LLGGFCAAVMVVAAVAADAAVAAARPEELHGPS